MADSADGVADKVEMPIPNGIAADTGRPLPGLEVADIAALAEREAKPPLSEAIAQVRNFGEGPTFGVVAEVDANNLSEAGWGIVFAHGADPQIKQALQPLLDLRAEEAGAVFKVFEDADGIRPGETAADWTARHGASISQVVEPLNGVPYHLLLVGSPQEIPFEFQYTLDIYWSVGRLDFDDLGGYERYANSVIAYERSQTVPHGRQAALFASSHDFDKATQMFTSQVAEPLASESHPRGPLGKQFNFALQTAIGESATKETLGSLFRGQLPGGPPALLMTGSHGMAFPHDDARLPASQGALVCQDWPGYGAIEPAHWFDASDLPADAQVHGLIHFFFACYSAGSPQFDTFDRLGPAPKQRAPRDLITRLPQTLLSHPAGGALATLGHIDRAWSSSFQSPTAGPQLQGFRDVMSRILRGDRVGFATDEFDTQRAALSDELIRAIQDHNFGAISPLNQTRLANRWVTRDNARNYVILGDPAVRLRVDAMPAASPDAA